MRFLLTSFCCFGFLIAARAQYSASIGDQAFLAASLAGSPVGGLTAPTLIRTTTNTAGSVSAITIPAFNCSGGNYALIAVGESGAANRTVSSITTGTGAQTATNIVTATYIGVTTGKAILYGIVNPTTGDVLVTMSGSCTVLSATVMLFNNVGSSGSVGSGTAGSDPVTSARTSTSDNLTTLSTDLVADSLVYNAVVGNPTQGGGQTLVAETVATASAAFIANSTTPGAAGTTTVTWSFASQVATWVGVALGGK